MTAIEVELQAQVDAQLLEQGAFTPLELLFSSGRLMYADYESWRRREIDHLDPVLMGDPANIIAELERAVSYARGIGLVEEPQETDRSRRLSADAQLHRLLANRYVPAQKLPQMDLFFDNPVVALTSGIGNALCAGNLPEAQRQLDSLYALAPNHADLAAFDQLVGALDRSQRPVEELRRESDLLLQLTPLARRVLGARARDFLTPLWRKLADTEAARLFSPGEPTLHRSFLLSQAQDWDAVRENVLRTAGWQQHAFLALRLTESCFQRRRRTEALTAWCHVCWREPAEAPEAVRKLKNAELTALWQDFQDAAEDEILGPESFPAWLLLTEPALGRQLPLDLPIERTPGEEHYRCVHRLLAARREQRSSDEMALRKALQAGQPVLFRALLSRTRG